MKDMSDASLPLFERLVARRKELGISIAVIAQRSGVSVPTVQRILAGSAQASMVNVLAVAQVLGLRLEVQAAEPAGAIKERQARAVAQRVAQVVQCSALDDSPAVPAEILNDLVERSTQELLRGPGRRLWVEA